MSHLENCQNLLNYYTGNGFRWNSAQVLEPLSLSMYELGYCDALFKLEFEILFKEVNQQRPGNNFSFVDPALQAWLNLKITDLNASIKAGISCLWLYLDYVIKMQEPITLERLDQILRRHFDPLTALLLNRTVPFDSLRKLIDSMGNEAITKESAESICTQFIVEFLNRQYRATSDLRRIGANDMTSGVEIKPRQQQLVRLLMLDQRLELGLLSNGISNSTYQRLFNCTRVMAKRDLSYLLHNKFLRAIGSKRGRSSRYALSDSS